MRKANKPKDDIPKKVEVHTSMTALKTAVTYLDEHARDKRRIELQKRDSKRAISRFNSEINNIMIGIKSHRSIIEESDKQLENLPTFEADPMAVLSPLKEIANLPWVESVYMDSSLSDHGYFIIDVIPEALQTTFYRRTVYSGQARTLELLERPLSLPLPTYRMAVKIGALSGNENIDGQTVLIAIKDSEEYTHLPDQSIYGVHQELRAHWASSPLLDTRIGEKDWTFSSLCLSEYGQILKNAHKKGITNLLNEVVMFLQKAGWSGAYVYKDTWAERLGFKTYCERLIRPLKEGETFRDIARDIRDRTGRFLEENNLTQHMIDYGSDSNDALPRGGRVVFEDIFRSYNVPPALIGDAVTFRNDMRDIGRIGIGEIDNNLI